MSPQSPSETLDYTQSPHCAAQPEGVFSTLSADLLATLASSSEVGATLMMSAQTLETLPASDHPISHGIPLAQNLDQGAPHQGHAHQQEALSQTFGPSLLSLASNRGLLGEPKPNVARFNVDQRLGAGAYGEVWRASDQDLGRPVAIKRFLGTPQQALASCQEELRFVGRLNHPGVPTVYQASLTEEGNPYLVMKLLEGESLQALLNRLKAGDEMAHSQFPYLRRVELILQLLRVVSAAHRANVLHRDIKPDNIYLSPEGELSLIDWGIAEDLEVAANNNRVCGTPLYMSPEQAQGRPLGRESDIFSVGAVAYELLALRSAAPEGETVLDILKAIPTHKPRQVDMTYHEAQGSPPSEFATPITRALSRDPSERYQYAEEMSHELQQALEGHFKIVCPRTMLKFYLFRFSRWIDRHPLVSLFTVYIAAPLLALLLISGGVLLGLAWAQP